MKAQGVQGLASDLQWLYNYFNPATVRNMPPRYFIIVSKTGALGLGESPYPEWHKKEKHPHEYGHQSGIWGTSSRRAILRHIQNSV